MVSKKILRTLFMKPKNPRLAAKISIKTPVEFRKSIRILKKGGINVTEKKALVLARTRAMVMLKRKDLSPKERKQMLEISKTKIPRVTPAKVR